MLPVTECPLPPDVGHHGPLLFPSHRCEARRPRLEDVAKSRTESHVSHALFTPSVNFACTDLAVCRWTGVRPEHSPQHLDLRNPRSAGL